MNKKIELPCELNENKPCRFYGNKRFNYGFVNGTAGYCFKEKRFIDKMELNKIDCPSKRRNN